MSNNNNLTGSKEFIIWLYSTACMLAAGLAWTSFSGTISYTPSFLGTMSFFASLSAVPSFVGITMLSLGTFIYHKTKATRASTVEVELNTQEDEQKQDQVITSQQLSSGSNSSNTHSSVIAILKRTGSNLETIAGTAAGLNLAAVFLGWFGSVLICSTDPYKQEHRACEYFTGHSDGCGYINSDGFFDILPPFKPLDPSCGDIAWNPFDYSTYNAASDNFHTTNFRWTLSILSMITQAIVMYKYIPELKNQPSDNEHLRSQALVNHASYAPIIYAANQADNTIKARRETQTITITNRMAK